MAQLPVPTNATTNDIRLIVQITVDGLRGNLLSRYMPSLSEDGFRRLIDVEVARRNLGTADVAAILSDMIGMTIPSGASGTVRHEVVD